MTARCCRRWVWNWDLGTRVMTDDLRVWRLAYLWTPGGAQ